MRKPIDYRKAQLLSLMVNDPGNPPYGYTHLELSRAIGLKITPLAPGAVIARDGARVWRAEPGEHLLFPNASVAVGLRAAVLVVPEPEPAQGASGSGIEGAGGASLQPPPSAR